MVITTDLVNLILLNFKFDWLHRQNLVSKLSNNFWYVQRIGSNRLNRRYMLNLVYNSSINYLNLVFKANTILQLLHNNNKVITINTFSFMLLNIDNNIFWLKGYTLGGIISLLDILITLSLPKDDIINTYSTIFNFINNINVASLHHSVSGLTSIGDIYHQRLLSIVMVKTNYINCKNEIKTINFNVDYAHAASYIINDNNFSRFISNQMDDLSYAFYQCYFK